MSCNHEECKKLAELLEIEPIEECKGCRIKENIHTYTCKDCNYGKTPCFQEPENFVKLLECKASSNDTTLFHEITSLGYFFNRQMFNLNVRNDFLVMLSNIFNGYSDDFVSISKQEKLKSKIQQTDWRF